ncbi:MAG: helix-turn-helix domain-containing protein, partial [Bacteroidales bacterium]|nr:helix-turn-helix domain-containing protein [Bacteroidales bacterium]
SWRSRLELERILKFTEVLKDYTMHKNDIFIVQSGQLGEFHGMSDDVQFFIIFVHNEFCEPLTQATNSSKVRDLMFRGPYHSCSAENMEEIYTVYKYILNKIRGNYRYKEDVIKGYLHAMLHNIYSWSAQEEEQEQKMVKSNTDEDNEGTKRHMELYNRFIELVQKHFAQEHKIGFYADKLCITPKYMSQIIYKVSGRFAKDFIRDSLVIEAKVLLKSGMPIQDVAYELNFNSPTFFSRFFKEATGSTPFDYQNDR